jgi:glycosyltransferase involved in cell wall biosynthesis
VSKTSLIVPAHRRPERLRRCLDHALSQRRPFDEVLVVSQADDRETIDVARAYGAGPVLVTVPGVLAAMTAGARAATGTLLGFCDDDVELPDDWLERALRHLDDPAVGAVSGRDLVDRSDELGVTPTAGLLLSWGRMVGDHHRVVGPPRHVDVLKGANMLWRREALSLPTKLRGTGAQVHYEIAMSAWADSAGYRLLLDPTLQVGHRAGLRYGEDLRGAPTARAVQDAAFNYVVAMSEARPRAVDRFRRLLFGVLVGNRSAPGLIRAALALVRREFDIAARLLPSLKGQMAGEVALLLGYDIGRTRFS